MRILDIPSKASSSVYNRCADVYNTWTKRDVLSLAMKVALVATPVWCVCSLVANIPKVEAGPIAYFTCICACESVAVAAAALTGGIMAPVVVASLYACTQNCLPLLALPFPP